MESAGIGKNTLFPYSRVILWVLMDGVLRCMCVDSNACVEEWVCIESVKA